VIATLTALGWELSCVKNSERPKSLHIGQSLQSVLFLLA
jgi:hypothetical protein